MQDKWRNQILKGDNLPYLERMPSESVSLIYIDPPFNTGRVQSRRRLKVSQADDGARVGFGGKKYHADVVGESGYADSFADFTGFLRPRLEEAHRILTDNGSLFFHIDWREAAHCRLLLEKIFGGTEHCINEIIWAYDYGARSQRKWSTKHDNIYWFAKNPDDYIFNYGMIDRIPYMAPNLVGKEKAARGKTPTDVWWNTIVPTNSAEKTGYPTQKPMAIVERIVCMHSHPGDLVLDFFAGSGTLGVAAAKNERDFVLIDQNADAIAVMQKRLAILEMKRNKEEVMKNEKYQQLVEIVNCLREGYSDSLHEWKESPFEWIKEGITSRQKGKIGKDTIREFLVQNEFDVSDSEGTDSDMTVNGHTVKVKFSTLWKPNDVYKFQQIRNQNYDILFCLGISMNAAHAWVVRKSDIIWTDIDNQHAGKKGKDTWWLSIPPANCSHKWMLPHNGDLAGACRELRKIVSQ